MELLKTLRWPLVVASLLVTLGVLVAGSYAVRAATQDGPLGAFLSDQPAVRSFRIEASGAGGRRITVALGDVPDLGQAYRDLDAGIERALGNRPYTLVVRDRRTPALAEVFYRVNPLVQEALATGKYANLVAQVESRALGRGADRVRVSLDGERVYVQLHAGADYLYEVLRRPDAVRPVPAASGGGWNL